MSDDLKFQLRLTLSDEFAQVVVPTRLILSFNHPTCFFLDHLLAKAISGFSIVLMKMRLSD